MRIRRLLIAVSLVALFLAFHVEVKRRGHPYFVIETIGDNGKPMRLLIPRDLPDAKGSFIREIEGLKREGKPYKARE